MNNAGLLEYSVVEQHITPKQGQSYNYIHCESKNCATFIFTVTLAKIGRFL